VGSSSDNGGWPTDGGSPDGLPDLPEEWGVIVIPDDLSELADEVRAVRAELALSEPQTRWQRFTARPAVRTLRRIGTAALRGPVLIISLAVLVTLASLFASAWPGPARTPATQRSASSTADRGETLPALEMIGSDGGTVALREELPAVVLIIDGCDCAKLVADTIAAVRPGVAVVTVTSAKPSANGATPPTGATPQAQGKMVRHLNDPTATLRSHLKLGPPDGTAAALVVDRAGEVVRTDRRLATVDVLKPALAQL